MNIMIYIGPIPELKDKLALVTYESFSIPGYLKAQFNEHIIIKNIDHGLNWHVFKNTEFKRKYPYARKSRARKIRAKPTDSGATSHL